MEPLRAEIRVVAGTLRGRKINCVVHDGLRPTPQMVREALFSILGNAVPDRPFYDLFAGTGVNGVEALSRGASNAVFVERDGKLAANIDKHLQQFGMNRKGQVLKADVYRWVERWMAPRNQPATIFLSPPFGDLTDRFRDLLKVVQELMKKLPDDSVIVVQTEDGFPLEDLPDPKNWDIRTYGRNTLCFWVKGDEPAPEPETPPAE